MKMFMRGFLWSILLLITTIVFAQDNNAAPTQEAYQQRIDKLTESIISNPNDADLYVERADQIYRLNAIYKSQAEDQYKLKKVVDDIDKAIEVAPGDPYLYSLRGSYKKLIYGDYEGAIQDLTKAIELNPSNPNWYFNRANYKSVEDACEDWKTCSDLGDYRCVKIYEQLCVGDNSTAQP